MPATPAWPPKSRVRLFVDAALAGGVEVSLDANQANYLGNVMRKAVGNDVLLFDGRSGEWIARITEAARKRMTLTVEKHSRPLERVPDLVLAFAPVKRTQTDWLVEKATELGVARLQPVMTQRTVAERVKIERLRSIAIEAAEQCNRTSLPSIDGPVPLARFLEMMGPERTIYFADEQGGAPAARAMAGTPAAILVGPEGGFTDDERALIRSQANATAISLGPRILRAETAALAAVAAFMTVAGDWTS